MMAYIPALALCQGGDEDLIIEMGTVISPVSFNETPARTACA